MNVHEKMSELRREMREGLQKVIEKSQEFCSDWCNWCNSQIPEVWGFSHPHPVHQSVLSQHVQCTPAVVPAVVPRVVVFP